MNACDREGAYPLRSAIVGGHEGVTKLLLGVPTVDVTMRDGSGETLMHNAITSSCAAFFVKALLEHGKIDPIRKSTDGILSLYGKICSATSDVSVGLTALELGRTAKVRAPFEAIAALCEATGAPILPSDSEIAPTLFSGGSGGSGGTAGGGSGGGEVDIKRKKIGRSGSSSRKLSLSMSMSESHVSTGIPSLSSSNSSPVRAPPSSPLKRKGSSPNIMKPSTPRCVLM